MLTKSLNFKNLILNHKQRLPGLPKHLSQSLPVALRGSYLKMEPSPYSTKKSSQLQPGLHFHSMQCKKQLLSAVTTQSLTCFTKDTAETLMEVLCLPTVRSGSRHRQQHNLQRRQTGLLSESSSLDTITISGRLTCKDLETHSEVYGKPQRKPKLISAKCCSQQ